MARDRSGRPKAGRHWLPVLLLAAVVLLLAANPQATQAEPGGPYPVHLPLIYRPAPQVVIAAAHIDSARSGEADEALQLWNLGPGPAFLADWTLEVNGRQARFPSDTARVLAPGEFLWCTQDATAFAQSFGFLPDCIWGTPPEEPTALVVLEGSALRLANTGGIIHLWDGAGRLQDALVYGNRALIPSGWRGPAAQAYARGSIPEEGQVWRRKPDPATGLPVDTDTARDWAGDLADLTQGRRAFFPGWRMWQHLPLSTGPVTVQGPLTVAVGPEALYTALAQKLAGARSRIRLSLYTFEHPELAQVLVDRAHAGVQVQVLLEGGPSGGVTDLQRWCVATLLAAGVEVRYLDLREDAPAGLRTRYRFLHAKYGLVDGDQVLVGTENPSWDTMPLPAEDGRWPSGRRGVYLFLAQAGPVAQELARIFDHDWDMARFADVRPAHMATDGPPPDFVLPERPTPWRPATPFQTPLTVPGPLSVQVVAYPDANALAVDPLQALLGRTGPGDTVRWLQLYEHLYWGETTGNPVADPNPRVQALLDAARRGAQVRVLLDGFFDDPADPRGNRATADFLVAHAQAEGLDLAARLANPTGLGIHAKVGLVAVGAERWVVVGSLNGGEVSHKLNREVVLGVQSPEAYAYLDDLFAADWETGDTETR